jgi:hypothetical protein
VISQDWLQDFANPPAGHRPMPLWVWNGRVTAAGITERLEQVAAAGMGGVFVHPRAGLVTEYLSPEWFDLWGHALKECERLGLECHIYDENSYPSGFAGGHVVANHPNLAATRLVAIKADSPFNPLPPWPEQPPIAAFRLSPEDAVLGTAGHEDMKKASPRHPILICRLEQEPARDWNAGFPYVDLTRAEATDAFIEATHQRYRAAFSPAFGRTIKYAFTDEPTLKRTRGLPVSRRFLRDFLAAYGYPLEECLAALFVDTPNAPAVRFDVYRLLDRRFTGNYARKLHDWCEQHGLKFTGHVNEHSWPQPDDVPCNMSFLRWMQVPGNDLLGFQFSPASLEANAIYLMNLKELSSVASQLGRERVIAESCGGGGYSMAPRDFKPLEDFLLVHGVNLINPHLSHQTLSGARKHDWAQTLSDHSPWWAVSKPHQDHVARCATALLRGREKNRVLVLQPDSTAWVQHRHDLDAEVVENSELTTGKAGQREMPLATLRAGQQRMVLALTRRQVDFDLGCEQILEELGSVAGARLRCGERDYDLFVLPAVTTNLFSSTVALLRAFLAAGGLVVSGQTLPRFVDGRPSGDVVTLRETFANQWHLAESTDELANRAASLVPPRVCVTRASHPDLLCRRHELPDGSTLFLFANPWDIPFSGEVKIEGHGLIRLDTGTGAAAPFPSRAASGNQQTVELNLSRRGHLLLISTPVARGDGRQPADLAAGTEPAARGLLRPSRERGRPSRHQHVQGRLDQLEGPGMGPESVVFLDPVQAGIHGRPAGARQWIPRALSFHLPRGQSIAQGPASCRRATRRIPDRAERYSARPICRHALVR